jgi:transposase
MKGRPVSIETKLKRGERQQLEEILRTGHIKQNEAKRARTLLLLSDGMPPLEVARTVGIGVRTVHDTRARYGELGLEQAVEGKPRTGRASPYADATRQKIIALACSSPPAGHSQWNCALLAEEAVRLGIVESIGRESVRIILASHELKPWREKNVVRRPAR